MRGDKIGRADSINDEAGHGPASLQERTSLYLAVLNERFSLIRADLPVSPRK